MKQPEAPAIAPDKAELIEDFKQWRVIPDLLRHRAANHPDDPFLSFGHGAWATFADVDRESDAIAAGLHDLGISKGDRVAIVLPNCREWVISLFALAKLGAVQVPVNVFLKGDFLGYQMEQSGACAVIADDAGLSEVCKLGLASIRTLVRVGDGEVGEHTYAELAASGKRPPTVEILPHDLVSVMYTSGTTGAPKGCKLSHGYYLFLPWGWFLNDWYQPGDRVITPLPLFHIAAQGQTLMSSLLARLPLTILPTFSASGFLDDVRSADATVAFGVGPMAMALLGTPAQTTDRDHRLRSTVFPPLPPAAREAFQERFAVPVCTEGYGQTECNPISQSPADNQGNFAGCLGQLNQWIDVQIHDEHGWPVPQGSVGEIVIRPREPLVMFSGYWDRDDATVEASLGLWHHTGDMGRFNEDGWLSFVDRRKDAIRRRGENISSMQLEGVVATHPAVATAAAHGYPSDLGDDDIKVWVALTPESELDPTEFHQFCAERLPYFAVPRYVQIVDQIPVNALGRVQKFKLREHDNSDAWDLDAMGLTIERSQRR